MDLPSLRRLQLGIAASALGLAALVSPAQSARPTADPAAAGRGAKLYAPACAQCHGADTRGTDTGPDLVRSLVVLHDRRLALQGAEFPAVLKAGPSHHFDYNKDHLLDLSQFLTNAVNKTLRSGYSNEPTHMLSGDAKAGEAYFNGAGTCSKCHSPTGNLAGIAKRYDPPTLQQKFLFPNSGPRGSRSATRPKKEQVTVTLPSGKSFSGPIVHIDDFNVSFRDDAGAYHSFARTGGVKVTTVNPYAAHVALLDHYTDDDIHNLTAYLETLQ